MLGSMQSLRPSISFTSKTRSPSVPVPLSLSSPIASTDVRWRRAGRQPSSHGLVHSGSRQSSPAGCPKQRTIQVQPRLSKLLKLCRVIVVLPMYPEGNYLENPLAKERLKATQRFTCLSLSLSLSDSLPSQRDRRSATALFLPVHPLCGPSRLHLLLQLEGLGCVGRQGHDRGDLRPQQGHTTLPLAVYCLTRLLSIPHLSRS
jgi:hypothetical protein